MRRHESIDAMRGLGVLLMLGATWLPGVSSHASSAFLSSECLSESVWHGLRFADMLMPLFLFCCGAAVAAEIASHPKRNAVAHVRHAGARVVAIFLLGLLASNAVAMLMYGSSIGLAGPLQQIAVAMFVTYCVVLWLPPPAALILTVFVVLNYGMLLAEFRLDTGRSYSTALYGFQSNLVTYVDSRLLPGNKSFGNWDQFGILPTIVSVGVALFGACFQQVVLGDRSERRLIRLVVAIAVGVLLAAVSAALSSVVPINHYLWTPSFIGISIGAITAITACLELVIHEVSFGGTSILQAWGRNSLLFFFVCAIFGETPLTRWNLELAQRIFPDQNSLVATLIAGTQVLLVLWGGTALAAQNRFMTVNSLLRFLSGTSADVSDSLPVGAGQTVATESIR